ncbi:MAG: nucleotidyltransferase family protein [Thaumarchaeota archaeon]|nr:nucleotidyltransferase family protein [Nitrososphaerota archaeon]
MILAGGAGTRMRPLTYVIPKVMLPIAGKPLLQRTMTYLSSYGVTEFVVCVAYLKKQIMDGFKDGSELGLKIHYAESESPLGTAGQLKTAERFIDGDTFLAMNGDIVTSMNIRNLYDTHKRLGGIGTISLKKYEVKVPYGFITVDDQQRIKKFEEKPTLSFMANAGIYILEPEIFKSIPSGRACSLETETFPLLISKGERMNSFYEEAYWADVGSMTDFERVNDEALIKDSEQQKVQFP